MCWATIRNLLVSVLIIFPQSIVSLPYCGRNASVYEQVSGDLGESILNAAPPNRSRSSGQKHVSGAGRSHGETRNDEDDGEVIRETELTELTPSSHRHGTPGPDGGVVIDAVDDPGEYRQLHKIAGPHQPTHRIPDNSETTKRQDCMVDRASVPQCSRPPHFWSAKLQLSSWVCCLRPW